MCSSDLHKNLVLSVAFSPNGQTIASGGSDNTAKLWDVPVTSHLREFVHGDAVQGLALSADTVPNHLLFEAGRGTTLLVYGRPSPNLADHTQVRFWSDDVAADVSELAGRGVEFELVEFGDFKMVDHVLTTPVGRSAWLKDPDGNTIALFQPA